MGVNVPELILLYGRVTIMFPSLSFPVCSRYSQKRLVNGLLFAYICVNKFNMDVGLFGSIS